MCELCEELVKHYPTITFCFQNDNLTYSADFNVSYNNMGLQGEIVEYEPEY